MHDGMVGRLLLRPTTT